MPPPEFGTFILGGERFDRNGVPIEALDELLTYREIVLEVTKAIYRREHPAKGNRTPNGLDAALDLRLTRVFHGNSVTAVLVRDPAGAQEDFDGALSDELDDLFAGGRSGTEDIVAAVAAGEDPPPYFTPLLASLFARLGKTLRAGESLTLGPPYASMATARMTPAVHQRFVEIDAAPAPTGPRSVVGAIVAINALHRTCIVETDTRQILCAYDISIARAIREHLASEETFLPKVAISGIANLRRDGTVESLQRITQLAKAGEDAREVIVAKLDLLRSLQPGWAGSGSTRIDERSIAAFEDLLQILGARATDELEPLGLADGGIRLEWHRFGVEYVAEIDPAGGMYMCKLPADPTGDQDQSRELEFDPLALARFFSEGEMYE